MIYQKILNTLDSLMPQISETNDPKSVMLKWARDNNVKPAQLQKLGHAFNQCKTLVALEKQANRGDSFSIVDVPEMLSEYTTYDPNKKTEVSSKKINSITKTLGKAAGSYTSLDFNLKRVPKLDLIDRFSGKIQVEFNDSAPGTESVVYDLTSRQKKASEDFYEDDKDDLLEDKEDDVEDLLEKEEDDDDDFKQLVRERTDIAMKGQHLELQAEDYAKEYAKEYARQYAEAKRIKSSKVKYANLDKAINECASIGGEAQRIILQKRAHLIRSIRNNGPDSWYDMSSEAIIRFDDCQPAIDYMENYMKDNHIAFTKSDAIKKASTRCLLQDKYNTLNDIKELSDAVLLHKVALYKMDYYRDLQKKIQETMLKSSSSHGVLPPPAKTRSTHTAAPDKQNNGIGFFSYVNDELGKAKGSVAESTAKSIGAVGSVAEFLDKVLPESKKQQKIQEKLDRTARDITLNKLMFQDPVLSSADPELVQNLINSIGQVSPTITEDPYLLVTALKESIQYGGLPLNIINDLAKFQNTINEAKLNKLKAEHIGD